MKSVPFAFVGMPSFGPAPDGLEDLMVDFAKGVFADNVSMVLCPTADDGIESCDEQTC